MAAFVEEYSALRWLAVAAFGLAALIVLRRLAAVQPGAAAMLTPGASRFAPGGSDTAAPSHRGVRAIDPESDAAHLLMCLVMLAMLVFPATVEPRALHGVLTAMTLVYALLLVGRILQWRNLTRVPDRNESSLRDRAASPSAAIVPGPTPAGGVAPTAMPGAVLPGEGVMAFAYHVVAAAAMLYAMSGHAVSGHTAPEPAPMVALAALFLADALAMAVPSSRSALRHIFPHPIGVGGPVAVLPHVVMDLGTAYMLIAAAMG
ncbi:DUF5134 domain-containing protein [Nocardia sp. 2]|uniref:DUF5134 domain-containing protein n=1 Tax=Nocardia acididurans TaxID=2802282 RepID=A0ABS1MEK1_9NOCA|nr:DUF5134 domain-containing protein [Nocardia acididurans]MBL1078971.1 DUF5134 domain-containing protein [Nocardia acididurans]